MLDHQQKIAHNLIIKALKLRISESSAGGGCRASRVKSLLCKDSAGKIHTLGTFIIVLKENFNFIDNHFLSSH